jgi:hypothetical protein
MTSRLPPPPSADPRPFSRQGPRLGSLRVRVRGTLNPSPTPIPTGLEAFAEAWEALGFDVNAKLFCGCGTNVDDPYYTYAQKDPEVALTVTVTLTVILTLTLTLTPRRGLCLLFLTPHPLRAHMDVELTPTPTPTLTLIASIGSA